MGIKLPESIVGRILITNDGKDAWGLSDSGIIYLPFGKLYDYPILMPETTQVFLANDDCNRGVAKGSLRINNQALPILRTEVIRSQSADVDIISGATLTSVAYARSLALALAQSQL